MIVKNFDATLNHTDMVHLSTSMLINWNKSKKCTQNVDGIFKRLPNWLLHAMFLTLWISIHSLILHFGTSQLPYHTNYIGDEQAPVIGALYILAEKNPLAISGLEKFYYGPLFAVLALPAVLLDFSMHFFQSGLTSAESYKNQLLYDWGGILIFARTISLVASYIGLVALFKILRSPTINIGGNKYLTVLGVGLMAVDYFYFSYGSLFRFWIFILVPVLLQILILIKMYEKPDRGGRLLFYQAIVAVFSFGIHYPALISQIVLLPWFVERFFKNRKDFWRGCLIYGGTSIAGYFVLILWNIRIVIKNINILLNDTLGLGVEDVSSLSIAESPTSFMYHLGTLVNNYSFLLLSLAILLFFFLRKKALDSVHLSIILAIFLFGFAYSFIFGIHSIQTARYAWPTILSLIFLTAILLPMTYKYMPRFWRILVLTLLMCHLLFHTVSNIFWLNGIAKDPVKRETAKEILLLQEKDPDLKILVTSYNLLGWSHTKKSYDSFAVITTQEGRSMFEEYAASEPTTIKLLDIDYSKYFDLEQIETYDVIYYCHDPIYDRFSDRESIDLNLEIDYPQVNLVRYWTADWFWEPYCDKYKVTQ